MRRSLFLLLLSAATCLHAAPKAPATSDPGVSLHAAAQAFCTALHAKRIEGYPTPSQLKRLSPLITPTLRDLLQRGYATQQRQQKAHPDEKPDWIEGDLFSSSFEGVTQWKLGAEYHAEGVDATVKVQQTYAETNQAPVTWTDTLVFKPQGQGWALDDIRMGSDWAFKAGDSLRGRLPGAEHFTEDHTSPDEHWKLHFQRMGTAVVKISVEPADASAPPTVLFGQEAQTPCPLATWVVWGPDGNLLAIRLGESERFTHSLIYRHTKEGWQPVAMPEFYPNKKQTMKADGFHEVGSEIDALRWEDARTLLVQYLGEFVNDATKDSDGYAQLISVRIPEAGLAKIVGAVEMPGDN